MTEQPAGDHVQHIVCQCQGCISERNFPLILKVNAEEYINIRDEERQYIIDCIRSYITGLEGSVDTNWIKVETAKTIIRILENRLEEEN